MGRKPGSKSVSATTDSARPGGPSTMDVLTAWITKPGNVRRWRSESHAPLIREIVGVMHDEGLAHRKAPFVRYKVDAIERQYLMAKKWLLETGMHDAYMRGKATPEVRAHVERVCPLFRKLDPAFHGVPFSKKDAETIELDADSVEDGESEEESKQEIKVPESEEEEESEEGEEDDEGAEGEEEGEKEDDDDDEESSSESGESEEVYDGEEDEEEEEVGEKDKKKTQAPSRKAPTPPKGNTFKNFLMAATAENEKTSEPQKKKKKKTTFREQVVATTAENEKTSEPQKKKKKKTTFREQVVATTAETEKASEKEKNSTVEKEKTVDKEKDTTEEKEKTAEKEKKKKTNVSKEMLVKVAGQETPSVGLQKKPITAKDGASVKAAKVAEKKNPSKPEAAGEPAPVKKRRGRPPLSKAAASPVPSGVKGTVPKAYEKKTPKTTVTKRKSVDEETITAKRTRTQRQDEESAMKRARTLEQDETERKAITEIEREALLKRVEDEQKQRHDVYELEQAKLKCELEAKQVQLLFEKATARKKLDQLGVPQEEIDRLLPL